MPKRILRALVGTWKPRRPTKSLPSYREPTPETNPKLTRENEAELALTRTIFAPGTQQVLIGLFLITIVSVPLLQFAAGLRKGEWVPMREVFHALPSAAKISSVRHFRDAWDLLPRAEELKSAEKALETESVVSHWLLPPVQSFLVGKLRAANEQVYLGRDGWLFYRPDVDYVTGPGFMSESWQKQRKQKGAVQPDPVAAIVQFRDQLAGRGIDLILLPIPTKATIDGGQLAADAPRGEPLQNASFAEFLGRMNAAGVRVFDPAPLLMERKVGPQYLQTDTHWRPETMEFVAQRLAATIQPEATGDGGGNQIATTEISGIGDVARMLKLPESHELYRPEKTSIRQVSSGAGWWRPSGEAEVLFLGDSFANIFSQAALGWGEAAGFAEHLSSALGGQPLDCILRNSDGAFATREMLANELARGRDRLAGKKLVIWEFAARELAFGNWKLLELKLGSPAPSQFFAPQSGEEVEVSGTIEAVASVPRPGSVPYKDHVMALHLAEVARPGRTEALQALVYVSSMRDNVWTDATRLRPGDRVRLRLKAWGDVALQFEQINRSEIDDPEIQLEEPAWGELLK